MVEDNQPKDCKFIMDCFGNFQISVDGVLSKPATYECIATVFKDNKTYIGVTQYHAGMLPTETVMQIIPVKTVMGEAESCNLFRPNDPCIHQDIKAKSKANEESKRQ
jgi:hypothetical protein